MKKLAATIICLATLLNPSVAEASGNRLVSKAIVSSQSSGGSVALIAGDSNGSLAGAKKVLLKLNPRKGAFIEQAFLQIQCNRGPDSNGDDQYETKTRVSNNVSGKTRLALRMPANAGQCTVSGVVSAPFDGSSTAGSVVAKLVIVS